MTPLCGAGLADCILVAEETDLVEGVGGVYGVAPLHAHKVFGLLRVIGCGAVERTVLQHVERGVVVVAFGGGHREVFGWLHGFNHLAHKPVCGILYFFFFGMRSNPDKSPSTDQTSTLLIEYFRHNSSQSFLID
jgi:hypothetical protein